jgi:DNA-binding beta-propeller fold protein YncE
VDAYGNAWIANRTGSTVTELTHSGAMGAGTTYSTSLNAPSAVALDASGNPWVAESGNSGLIYLMPGSGTPVSAGSGGLNAPAAAAIDAQGNVWVANSGANTVSEFTSAGSPVTASGYSGAGIVKPLGIAISPH